jgi:hypothetical protein
VLLFFSQGVTLHSNFDRRLQIMSMERFQDEAIVFGFFDPVDG